MNSDTVSVVDTAVAADTVAVSWTAWIAEHMSDKSLDVLKMIGLSLLVIAVTCALLKLTSHLFHKIIDHRITANREKWFRGGIRFRNIKILSASKLTSMALLVSRILRYAVYALLIYTALPILFAIFPATRHFAGTLLSWVVSPLVSMAENFIAYLPKLLRIIVIIVVMRYLIRFLHYVSREIEGGRLVIPGFYADWAHATFNLLRIFIIAFTIVLIFPLLPESESTVFRGVSVFIGVLFSIGSSSVISNMMAGLVVTYMRSFKIGNRIKVGDVYGDVVEKTLFVVRVKTVKNEIVTVPNSTVLASNVVNYSAAANIGEHGTILYQTVEIGYDVTCERATELLVEAALKTEHVLRDPPPFVLAQTLGYCAGSYQINVYTKRPDLQAKILSDINRYFFEICLRDKIDLPVPYYGMIRNWEVPKT